jgi:hypothetical protein
MKLLLVHLNSPRSLETHFGVKRSTAQALYLWLGLANAFPNGYSAPVMLFPSPPKTPVRTARFWLIAVFYFLAANFVRIALLSGRGDGTWFEADYFLPPAVLWLLQAISAPRWLALSGTLVSAVVVLTGDALLIAGRQFRWGPDAIPQFISAYSDLPWNSILPVALTILLSAILTTILLIRASRMRFSILPLCFCLAVLVSLDFLFGASGFRSTTQGANLLTSSSANLAYYFANASLSGVSVRPLRKPTLLSDVLQRGPQTQILSVAVESLGLARAPGEGDALLEALLKEAGRWYDLDRSSHRFYGSTLQGELRELCGVRLIGNASEPEALRTFSSCLPSMLRRQGYDTWAFHGNGGRFYNRRLIYPVIGFAHARFFDDLREGASERSSCANTVFHGICDRAVFEQAIRLFDGRKRFVHVMTLDTHLPIDVSPEQRCKASPPTDSALCGYYALLAESLADLGHLLALARIKPDVVYVYGDHAPPFSKIAERQHFAASEVPFWTLRLRHNR